jgi:uncharacterized membrane protein
MPITWYVLFKSVHVLAAVTWVGGALFASILGARAAASGDGPRMASFAGEMEIVGMRVFMPASMTLIATGVGMMLNGDCPWAWRSLWVSYGLAIWVVGFALGIGYFGPQSGRLAKLIAAEGPDAPEVKARIRQILVVSRLELVLLLGAVWAMVAKPTTAFGGTKWIAGAAVVLAVALVAVGRGLLTRTD